MPKTTLSIDDQISRCGRCGLRVVSGGKSPLPSSQLTTRNPQRPHRRTSSVSLRLRGERGRQQHHPRANPRHQSLAGWNRDTVELGSRERTSGIVCLDNFAARGNKKLEAKRPELERDIRALADPHSQTDPPFKSAFSYCA